MAFLSQNTLCQSLHIDVQDSVRLWEFLTNPSPTALHSGFALDWELLLQTQSCPSLQGSREFKTPDLDGSSELWSGLGSSWHLQLRRSIKHSSRLQEQNSSQACPGLALPWLFSLNPVAGASPTFSLWTLLEYLHAASSARSRNPGKSLLALPTGVPPAWAPLGWGINRLCTRLSYNEAWTISNGMEPPWITFHTVFASSVYVCLSSQGYSQAVAFPWSPIRAHSLYLLTGSITALSSPASLAGPLNY